MSTDRRRFLKLIGWSGVAAAAANAVRFSPASGAPAPGSPPPSDSAKTATASSAPAPPSAEARALTEALHQRFPHLTAAELETIAGDVNDRLDTSRALAKLPYTNADEPDATFRP